MTWLRNLVFAFIEPQIQACVTDRLLRFHQAMVDRGQIHEIKPKQGEGVTSEDGD